MTNPSDLLPPESDGLVNVIIETPQGSRNKYKYDEKQKLFALSRVEPSGHVFPFDFGFVPGTAAGDGDPIDVLVITECPTFTGCLIRARLIGVIEAEQTSNGNTERDDRLIAVAAGVYISCAREAAISGTKAATRLKSPGPRGASIRQHFAGGVAEKRRGGRAVEASSVAILPGFATRLVRCVFMT